MANQICFKCFKAKGNYEVCPHCGYVESAKAEQVYMLSPGTVLRGRYIIGICIGFGGFGITYRSFDTVLGVVVAIKEFYPAGLVSRAEGENQIGIFSGDKEAEFSRQKARFIEEARNMAIFSKEHDIVNVFDFFEENHTAYIIMEYIEGKLLKERLKDGPMPVAEATDYMIAILDALQKVHRNGIIHRDISPDNIFLTGEKSVKIFDFGAAKFQGTESERSEAAVVKAGYTPPEQYRSKNEQGAFMDVYAAGAVFYHMVTGEKPLEAPDRGMEDELQLPSELGVEIDANLERIIMKSMALKVEHRFQTAEQFRDAIVSGKKVRMPEDTGLTRKIIIGAGIMGVGAVGLIAAAVVHTAEMNNSLIDAEKVGQETVRVWLCADDEQNTLAEELQESVSETYDQITVEVECFSLEEYSVAITTAAAEGSLPDVFCTDYMNSKEYCEVLTPLLNTLDLGGYYFWDTVDKDSTELPTSFQVGVVYRNDERAGATNEKYSLSEIGALEGRMVATEENGCEELGNKNGTITYLLGDISDLSRVRASTVEKQPPIALTVCPVEEDGSLVGCYKYCYGIQKDLESNRKNASMLVLSVLGSDHMQSSLYMNNENGIPVNKITYSKYEENKLTSDLAFVKEYGIENVKIQEDVRDLHLFFQQD